MVILIAPAKLVARLWPGDVCRGVLLRSSSSSQHTVDHIISHVGYTAAVSYQKQTVLSTCIINGCLLFGQLKCSFKSYLSRYCLLDDCLMTVKITRQLVILRTLKYFLHWTLKGSITLLMWERLVQFKRHGTGTSLDVFAMHFFLSTLIMSWGSQRQELLALHKWHIQVIAITRAYQTSPFKKSWN